MNSKIKINALGIAQIVLFLMGLVPFLFFVVPSYGESAQEFRILILMILMLFVGAIGNWISMLINSVKHSRVGWTLAIVFLPPLACWIYFLLIYVPKSGNYISGEAPAVTDMV